MVRTAEIAGAGFAGLTVAIELARRGWRVRVHEASPELRAFGAGIFLWENGLQVLAELGVQDRVLATSYEATRWEERDSDNGELGSRPLPVPGGLRMITLTRRDLLTALVDAALESGVSITTGSRAVRADDGALCTEDGSVRDADLVVGADGIRSAVRDSLDLLAEHEVFDLGLYRFLVPLDRAPSFDGQWRCYANYWNLRSKRRVLYVPCNERELYLGLGAHASDGALSQPLDSSVWCESFPVLRPVLSELPAAPRYDRYEVLRARKWSSGRVAVVGDAAHAMPPSLGQGAGTAMMNALNLARSVADHDDVVAALRDWEAENRPLTEHAQQESVAIARNLFPVTPERRDGWGEGAVAVARNVPKAGESSRS
ncbi:FAD-dependent monooxygenase [Saccharopolyspora indica]|uniref:FAD-dependent oxidoreductase n=1 Tax=Saccharopolyspora indica TaxID=1229659 RepID=UPI0022EB1A83|nr:NAD(P)/FAD-dependent oxidoreductase [Saccharopolyspora indica]MDA3645325.1 NAD(P)/FAD-dependent oxidoreductase [Saccharopolyspora indica]